MKKILIINAMLVMSLIAKMTYAEDSLWGSVDAPAKPPKTTTAVSAPNPVVPKLPDSIDAPLAPVPDLKPVPQKTTCEILKAKIILTPEVMNTPEMQDQIKRTMQVIPDTYKFIAASPQAMTELYKAYSTQYIQQYCNK